MQAFLPPPTPLHVSPPLGNIARSAGQWGQSWGGVGGEGEAESLLHLSGGLTLASKGVACAARVLRGSP